MSCASSLGIYTGLDVPDRSGPTLSSRDGL
jgi:hypothetical protein